MLTSKVTRLTYGWLLKGVKFYVQMPADLDQFRRDNSHGTVVGGKRLVQLCHYPADGGDFSTR